MSVVIQYGCLECLRGHDENRMGVVACPHCGGLTEPMPADEQPTQEAQQLVARPSVRLKAWLDDVQLSNRLGTPHYANPGELKADLRDVLEDMAAIEQLVREEWRLNDHSPSFVLNTIEQVLDGS